MYPQVTFPVSPFLMKSSGPKMKNKNIKKARAKFSPTVNPTTFTNSTSALSIQSSSLNSNPYTISSMYSSNSPLIANTTNVPNSTGNTGNLSAMQHLIAIVVIIAIMLLTGSKAFGQVTYGGLQTLKVNPLITTVITTHESIEFVDLSTKNIIADKTYDNTFLLKPVNGEFEDGEFLATLTIITERYKVQFGLVYTEDIKQAVSDKQLDVREMSSFKNPEIKMSQQEMHQYANKILNSTRNIRNISYSKHKMKIRLNNLYSIGGYFFLDYTIENKTNIPFDIDEVRLKLADKKVAKATNTQVIEIRPTYRYNQNNKFGKKYHDVIVIPKMTFPNDKSLRLEISETQISGRNMVLEIDYEDILNADMFSTDIIGK